MPCLNSDLLFQIGKKLIEEGKQEDVFKFAFSGIQPLQAMKRVFSSVTTLKLYTTNYEIGWGDKCCKFELESDKLHCKFLMHQIGSCVKKIRINCKVSFLHQMYQPVIDKILAQKQLIDFSVGPLCTKSFLDGFVPVFSTSLKHVTLPNKLLTHTFRDTLELESLTIINPDVYNFAMFCCKTSSLKFVYTNESPNNFVSSILFLGYSLNPALISVKELTIESSSQYLEFFQFKYVIEYFPSLESMNYNITTSKFKHFQQISVYVLNSKFVLIDFMDTINKTIKVPPKITCSIYRSKPNMKFYNFDECKFICEDFKHVESVEEFHCFRKTIQSGDNESILLEIQFDK